MDVNYILARRQVELALARAATHGGARAAHQLMADRYGDMVEDYRHGNGSAAAAAPLSARAAAGGLSAR